MVGAANPAVTCTLVVNGGWAEHGNGFRWSPFHARPSGPVYARGAGSIRAASLSKHNPIKNV